jgi:Ni,Fe-hydrogenase III small subunit/NAD-dependent dihydropyrimidine dehydrogenase PreA subunit
MLKAWRVRVAQGRQFVPDVRAVSLPFFRGLPRIEDKPCEPRCRACVEVCPANAITLDPVRIDLGRCTFCDECTRACPVAKISFTSDYRIATSTRDGLVVGERKALDPVAVATDIRRIFGRSLRLRSVSAGGCNGCELEINALSNVNFDIQRFGIELVASPRHADGLVLSGPISRNMARALELAYEGMPDPKFVIAVGACAISGGVFESSTALDRSFLGRFEPRLYVPGCPPHPLTFVCGILDLLGRK